MNKQIPYTMTELSVTALISGQMLTVDNSCSTFEELRTELNKEVHDSAKIADLMDRKIAISRYTQGAVKIIGNTVYYQGTVLNNGLTEKLLQLMDAGMNISPWVKFLEKVEQCPTETARTSLFNFIDHFQAPITPEGNFIVFKGVTNDYKDQRTRKLDNSIGATVSMPREDVVEDPNVTCSSGLHVCATSYLNGFWDSGRVIVAEVDPRDVVSVPVDYAFAKMRVCKYIVIGDAVREDGSKNSLATLEKKPVIDKTTNPIFEDFQRQMKIVDGIKTTAELRKTTVSPLAGSMFRNATGKFFSHNDVKKGVAKFGQTGYGKLISVPRTTIQEWLKRIN